MTRYIKYVTDEFLKEFKNEFLVNYAHLYKSNDMDKLKSVFSDPNHVIETHIEYEYEPLEVEPKEYDADIVRRNIRRVWDSLKVLTPVQAEMEKIWVALAHTDYIDYQMGIFNSQIANPDNKKREESSLKSRTIFVNGAKRSLAIHNLAILWWLAYYFRDDQNIEAPYHLIDFFVSTPYRGNAVAILSSNIISNKEIALGILEAVKVLIEEEGMVVNRFPYSEAGKILNEVGGVRILDTLTREEVKAILINNLPNSHKVSFVNDKAEDDISLAAAKEENQDIEITELERPIEPTETNDNVVILSVERTDANASVSETNKVADLSVLEGTTQQEKTEDDDDMWIAPV
ncbi:MAG: DUF6339 family protein [Veillonella sp.]|uniref:DUF6339 family protein n=1 Tax=Veillonella sp. TaxID=1926307 RepID=UPI0029006E97|nr:DUF6339 family protein [Veillonella sp.]MDU2062617.1 DUF6339 family protein [Veillonella sp.]MDU2075874.1 DUF6339 family protein [Veillonella sp.]MDU2102254.1 DUF6339 family protein [Veillonella sp.]MDU2116335.1 DUF6339 family protein [Veillonella sp.]